MPFFAGALLGLSAFIAAALAVLNAMATACFCGLPAFISFEMFELIDFLEYPLVSGIFSPKKRAAAFDHHPIRTTATRLKLGDAIGDKRIRSRLPRAESCRVAVGCAGRHGAHDSMTARALRDGQRKRSQGN